MLTLAALGFCGGIPNLFATSLAPAWATVEGWGVELIGFLALFQLPYALKFLWAPLVDRVHLPVLAILGQRRSWILASQLLALACIAAASLVAPVADEPANHVHNTLFMCLLCGVVLFSATQDIVSDAYRAEVLSRDQLGAGAGIFVSGYRVGFIVMSAGVLAVVGIIGWTVALLAMCSIGLVGITGTLMAREPDVRPTPEPGLSGALVAPLTALSKHWGPRLLALILFVLVFRLPDQLANTMTTPLLLKGLGYSLAQLGWIRHALGFTLTVVGAIAGGWIVARIGLIRSLVAFGTLQALSNLGFYLLALFFNATTTQSPTECAPVWALVPVIVVENFAGGMVAAGFVAFLMSACEPRHVATQYAMLTALMAAGGALAGALSGVLTKRLDYSAFFLLTIASGMPGIALIALMRAPARTPSPERAGFR